ncbi:MAG: sigma-54 interaction domain-containing protein [Gammaproteobacteria bacterium]
MNSEKKFSSFLDQLPVESSPLILHELLKGLSGLCGSELALYVIDDKQRIVLWSTAMEELTELPFENLAGKVCPPEYRIDADSDDQPEITIKTGGKFRTVNKKSIRLTDPGGNIICGMGLLVPLSEPESRIRPPRVTDDNLNFQGIISRSPAMRNVFQIIQNAAETEATVLVRGESGSGKELVAKAIHTLSVRKDAPFLAINCAALSGNLLESELFGHMRGAFTGAIKDHKGLFQRAHGGTLFLDEVAELPLELQAKLLRVIQERNYLPVGGDRSINVDVRLVAATHRSLREEVKQGNFREDLMYRLRVVPIFLPPLRERREDIGLLLWHFIRLHNIEQRRVIEKIDPQAMRSLLDYHWPGNVRELHNVIEYAFAVGRGATLRLSELPPEFRETDTAVLKSKAAAPASPEQEKEAIQKALKQYNGMITAAAESLKMSRATFWRKRKLYGM